ncbi:MAG: TonB-dependent receptor [Prevotellaceae bacterium]|nr:TonB-dependent receptor [Prevotellaceae bacterium]
MKEYTYPLKKVLLLFVCLLATGLSALWAQTSQVSGIVTESGQPLIGASVSVKGTTTAVLTDVDGRYTINVPENTTLVFAFVGLRTQEIAVGARSVINVTMEAEATQLENVIVVAYGTTKKESFVGSAGVVSSKQLAKRTVSNVTKALEGTVAGVQTTSGSGQPGSSSTIRVRGFGSINSSSNPLYVVDGAPYDGAYSAISPDDIESITILKDASAGALYGARGANGVVLITTKSGTEGKLKVTLKATWGIASRAIPRYDLMDEKDWIETNFVIYKNAAIFNNAVPSSQAGTTAIQNMLSGAAKLFGENEQYNPYNMPIAQLIDPVTGKVNPNAQLRYHQDWLDEASTDNPLRQEYLLNVSGGNKETKYYFSFGYLNEEGLVHTTSFERLSGRLNVDSQVKPWLKLGASANVSFNKTNSRSGEGDTNVTNVWYAAQQMAPIYPVFEVDAAGNILYDDTGKPVYDLGSGRASGGTPNFNSVGQLFADKFYNNSDNLTARAFTEIALDEDKYGFAKGLNFKVDVNVTTYNSRSTSYYDQRWGTSIDSGGNLTKRAPRSQSFTLSEILGYKRSFGEHNIDFIAGHEYYAYKANTLTASKTKFPFPDIYELNPGAVLDNITSAEDNYRIESFLSRLKYSYADKYNFEASFRTDGSSRFHTDSRWGQFWSVGANWRLSEEDFMSGVDWMDNLSLRVSYGEQGNDALLTVIGGVAYDVFYAWQSFYDIGYANANNNGAVISSLESRELKWEKNRNFNVGMETRLFDRINLTAEFFHRVSEDMLLEVPMALSLGFGSYNDNIGSMYNRGFELALGIDVVKSDNFDWTLNILGSSIVNRITALATERPIISGSRIYKVGEPLYSYYLPRSAGVDPATGEQLYYVWDDRDPITDEQASDAYISEDVSKATTSREVCGSKLPDFYGSIGSEFTILKNIDFSFLTVYSIGGVTTDVMYEGFMDPLRPGINLHNNAKRAWQKPGDITDIPRLQYGSDYLSTQSHLLDASYFGIRNITLGYTLPKKWTDKIRLSSLRLYVAADNVVTFSALDGFDPVASLTGSLSYNYTPVRTVSLGINVNF